LAEVERSRPDILCLSGLIMAAFESMKATVSLVRSQQERLGYRLPAVLASYGAGRSVWDIACPWSSEEPSSTAGCASTPERIRGAPTPWKACASAKS
jgi:hypothetical protein